MNAISTMACASSGDSITWDGIDWASCERSVSKLQARIVKATKVGRHGKVKADANPYDPQWKSYFAGRRRTVVAGPDQDL